MTATFISAALVTSTLFHADASPVRTDIKQKIEQSVSAHHLNLPLEVNQKGMVRLSLKVDENGKLQIVEANYSHVELRNILADKLASIDVDKSAVNEVFFYEFHFEKH